jgi:hypothetical protein
MHGQPNIKFMLYIAYVYTFLASAM